MPSPLADTVVDARELIGRPGASRSLERDVVVPDDLTDDLIRLGPHVTMSGLIESVVDGLLVRGTVRVPARVACSRCLAEFDEQLETAVVELFSPPGDDAAQAPEPGYVVHDDAIDLDTLVRDALADVRPLAPLCRPDCAGLCPTCGVDRNIDPCDGHPDVGNTRWAKLADLHLPDSPPAQ